MSSLLILFYALLAMSVLMSLLGIVNTLNLSVHERTRELGMLRAMGMTRRQARGLIRNESMITAAIGSIIGVALGIFLAWVVVRSLSSEGIVFALPGSRWPACVRSGCWPECSRPYRRLGERRGSTCLRRSLTNKLPALRPHRAATLAAMRRLIPIAIVAVMALAGCGSSAQKSASTFGGARSTELSYFGQGSPFVMSLATAPSAASVQTGLSLMNTFPAASFGEQAIISKLQQVGINYQTDIKPLFGNPIMFGAASSTLSGSARNNIVAVWVTNSAAKLAALIKKIPGLSAVGTHDGATLYGLGTTAALAVSGATLVIGSSGSNVNATLDRHASGRGFSAAEYARLSTGLPQDTLMTAFGDLSTVLSTTQAAKARSVPWIGAIRGYAASISATGGGLSFQYRVDTSGRTLSAAQLPIAPGTAAPSLAGSLPITVGVADPAQIVTFAEAAEQITSPAGWAKYEKRQAAAKAKTGFNLDDLFKQLTGNLIISSDTHTTMGRAAVADASQVSQVVTKLATQPGAFFAHSTKTKSLGGGFYSVRDGKTTLTIGVASGELLVGKASVAQLRAFAAQPATPAAGAPGSVAFRVALLPLLHLTLKKAPPQIAQVILSALGNISGWTQASAPALTGSATLAVK